MAHNQRRSGATGENRGKFQNRPHPRINRRVGLCAVLRNRLVIPDQRTRRVTVGHAEVTADKRITQLRGHHFGKNLINQGIHSFADSDGFDETILLVNPIPDRSGAGRRGSRLDLHTAKPGQLGVKRRVAETQRVEICGRRVGARLKPEGDGAHGWPPSLSGFFLRTTKASAAIDAKATPRQMLREA